MNDLQSLLVVLHIQSKLSVAYQHVAQLHLYAARYVIVTPDECACGNPTICIMRVQSHRLCGTALVGFSVTSTPTPAVIQTGRCMVYVTAIRSWMGTWHSHIYNMLDPYVL